MSEAQATVTENFAYCVLQLEGLQQVAGSNKFSSAISGDVIGFNTKVGRFEASVTFEVIGKQDQIIEAPKVQELEQQLQNTSIAAD